MYKETLLALVTSVVISMKQSNVQVVDVIFFLSEIEALQAKLTTARKQCLLFDKKFVTSLQKKCHNINDIFTEIKGYYSWFNYFLIQKIIKTFCRHDNDINQMIEDYKHKMKRYSKNRVCRVSQNGFNFLRKDRLPIVFKIDKKWDTMRVSAINTITATIRQVLNLRESTICLRTVSNGCVELTYDLPEHVADIVFPLPEAQMTTLRTEIQSLQTSKYLHMVLLVLVRILANISGKQPWPQLNYSISLHMGQIILQTIPYKTTNLLN